MDRRKFISGATATALLTASCKGSVSTEIKNTTNLSEKRYQNGKSPWPICLDTATIRPVKGLDKKVDIAIAAGYDAIEPWDSDLMEYEKNGGDLKKLGKRIRDAGLFVPSMIGLWGSIPKNEEEFQASLPATRDRLRMASEIGCTYAQTIPNQVGENYDHVFVVSCYARLLEIGIGEYNVIPALVFVKMFPLKTMGQAVGVALDTNHPQAKIIPDVYHMYISEGGFNGMKLLNGSIFAIFQFNDAPKDMDIKMMEDKHRVFPGDGILPLPEILKDLKSIGYKGCVSLEMYNPEYYKEDMLEIAKTGLQKTIDVIVKAEV
tara:strand:- start:309 stop:1265 length:957 start_codon:yes stop_codon:yes gene_type:complete